MTEWAPDHVVEGRPSEFMPLGAALAVL